VIRSTRNRGRLAADIDWPQALHDGTRVLEGDERYLFHVT
jgi:hypothetical protein